MIVPQLFYNESSNWTFKHFTKNLFKIEILWLSSLSFVSEVNLSKFFLNNVSVYNIPCAPVGQYDVLVASRGNAQINVNISQQKPFLAQKLLQYVQTSRIRYENRIHKRQTIFKWDKRYDIFISFYLQLSMFLQVFCRLKWKAQYYVVVNSERAKNSESKHFVFGFLFMLIFTFFYTVNKMVISNNLLVNSMLKYFETVNLTFTWCSIVWQLTLTIISKHFVMPSIMSLESHQNCFVHD